jgi:hypothetical protein
MDASRFDAWTRHLTTSLSRRAVPGLVLSGVTIVGLGFGARRDAIAGTVNADAPCTLDSQCTTGICYQRGRCKKKGKLTGKCRCGCLDPTNCAPFGKTCCVLGNEINVCLVAVMGNCQKDSDCCQSLCRDGRCCFPNSASCSEDGNCCSNQCSSGVCF